MPQLNGSAGHPPLVLDPNKLQPFKPRGDDGPTLLLRVPRVSDRAAYRHAVLVAGGKRWKWFELLATAEDAVRRLIDYDPELQQAWLQDLAVWADEVRAAILAWQEERSDELLEELMRKLTPSGGAKVVFDFLTTRNQDLGAVPDPVLAKRIADNETYMQVAGVEAAKLFLRGWDLQQPFKKTIFGIDEEQLQLLRTDDLVALAGRVEGMLEPPEESLGNSKSESSTSSSPPSSSSTRTPRRNGHSKGDGGTSASSAGPTDA